VHREGFIGAWRDLVVHPEGFSGAWRDLVAHPEEKRQLGNTTKKLL